MHAWARPSFVGWLAVVVAGCAVACTAAAEGGAAAAAPPSRADFTVAIDGGPMAIARVPADARPSLSNCTPSGRVPPLTVTCAFPYTWRSQQPLEGSITWTSAGRSGRFKLLCEWQVDTAVKAVLDVDSSFKAAGLRVGFSGSGTQPCSWSAAFGDSTLQGTMSGRVALGLVGGDTAPPADLGSFEGTFDVAVVSGTGEFAGATGTGTFTERETFDFAAKLPSLDSITALIATLPRPQADVPRPTTPAQGGAGGAAGGAGGAGAATVQAAIEACMARGLQVGTPALDACASAAAGVKVSTSGAPAGIRQTALRRAEQGSQLSLSLRSGQPAARIVAPPVVAASSSYALHLAAPVRSSCTAVATGKGKRVPLGAAADADGDGSVLLGGRVGKLLGPGTWQVAVTCKAGAATSTSTSALVVR